MSAFLPVMVVGLLAVVSPLAGQQRRPASPDLRAQVLVLGTYHMAGSGDYLKTATDDVLSPTRQREIEALVDGLAAFRPTRIMVEAPLASDSALNTRYLRYVAGTYTLTANEIDQVGFRLAKRLGHAKVFAIDYTHNEDVASVVGWAAQNGDTGFVNFVQRFAAGMAATNDTLRRLTIMEHLRRLNAPEVDEAGEAAYLRMARVGVGSNFTGADVVVGRYARNLKIFAAMSRDLVPGDRVLVLYGASHGKALRDFVRGSPDLHLVEASTYLTTKTP